MLKLTTFGGLSLARDGQPMTGAAAQRSRLALLALLASAGPAGISRDKLLLYLWPESDSERARHALKQAVYALRRDLGDEETIQGTASLCLNAALIESDVREFEAALAKGDRATAVALYTGAFLDGVYLKEAPEFERWCAEMRTRLSQEWAKAVEGLARDCEAKGEWRDAVGRWRQLAAAEPLSGRNTMLLMRALAESGDTSAALAQYRVHESLMQQEMESAPDPEVAKLADDMKQGRWQRSAPVAMAAPVAVSAPPTDSRAASPAALQHATVVADTNASIAAPPRRSRRRRWVAISLVTVVALIALAFTVNKNRDNLSIVLPLLGRSDPKPHPNVVVVAAFENKTGSPAWDNLGPAMADWLIDRLERSGRVKVLPVIDRQTSSFVVSKLPSWIPGIGRDAGEALAREVGGDTLITGSIYLRGDSLVVDAKMTELSTRTIVGAVEVTGGTGPEAVRQLTINVANRVIAKVYAAIDMSGGAAAARLTSPPTPEAHELTAKGWLTFFERTAEPAKAFELFDKASKLDSLYTGPWVMRAYILDVKGYWRELDQLMPRLRALRPRMMPAEEAALDMYEADMAGDSYERLEATRRLSKIRSGSAEMPVLVGVTCLYIGHPAEALAAFKETDGDHGLNAITPVYWGWLGIAQHFAGDTVGERATAREGVKRHPHNRLTVGSAVAWAARSGDTAAIAEQLENRLTDDGDTTLARREMTLFAGRELRAHGHPDAAAAMFRRVLDETTRPTDNSLRARTQAAYARYELGQYDAARPMFEALRIADQTNVDVIGRLGALAVRLKDSVTATRFDNELGQMKQPYLFGRAKKWRAHIAALRGRTGEALSMLEAATKDGYRFMDSAVIDIHHDADFVDLIATPEYKKFLRQMAEITRK